MRTACVILAAFLVGCRHSPAPRDLVSNPIQQFQPAAVPPPIGKKPSRLATKPARIVPVHEISGRIAAVNENLRFVVVDFFLSPQPRLDQRLGVYRQGQKVGEIKISPYQSNQNIAADIIAGEASIGDEVRAD